MKESEFIQLLNLYLDHELSAADAARLEAEVQANPARRKIYQQYCRMQKACKVLAADFVATEAGEATNKKVIAFNPVAAAVEAQQRARVRGFYAMGGLAAAAACLTLVFVSRSQPGIAPATVPAGETVAHSAPATAPAASTVAAKATLVAATQVAAPASATPAKGGIVRAQVQPTAQPSLVSEPLLLSAAPTPAFAAVKADAGQQFDWMQKLQFTPVQPQQQVAAENLRFDTRAATLHPELRNLGMKQQPEQDATEMNVIRFTR